MLAARWMVTRLAYQATVQGQGIALANRPLIETELSERSLVIAVNEPLITGRAYYLLWSKKLRAKIFVVLNCFDNGYSIRRLNFFRK